MLKIAQIRTFLKLALKRSQMRFKRGLFWATRWPFRDFSLNLKQFKGSLKYFKGTPRKIRILEELHCE